MTTWLRSNDNNDPDDVKVTVVYEGEKAFPLVKDVFINGKQVVVSADHPVELSMANDDIAKLSLTLLPNSIEFLREEEVQFVIDRDDDPTLRNKVDHVHAKVTCPTQASSSERLQHREWGPNS